MSAYVQAVLADIVNGRGDKLARLDMSAAIHKLCLTKQLTDRHTQVLSLHLQGYSVEELRAVYADAYTLLTQTYSLIAEVSGYTDELFLQQSLSLFPKYRKILPALRRRIASLGRTLA